MASRRPCRPSPSRDGDQPVEPAWKNAEASAGVGNSVLAKVLESATSADTVVSRDVREMRMRDSVSLPSNHNGQQTIYPGGYTLAEANISIAGRGVIMTKNYRNTVEIADFALSLVAGDEFVDIEGAPSKADVTSEVVRHGTQPKVTRFTSRAGRDRSLIEQVRSLLLAGVHLGDIGILTPTNFATNDVSTALAAAGLKSIELLDYDDKPVEAITVGTIKRAKGLEFKRVLVVRTPPRLLEPAPVSEDSAETERRELDRRELYVAMTRARNGLRVGVA